MKNDFIWVEKYRPNNINDIIIPESIKTILKNFIEQGQIPNLLLTSPCPGTGKTTTARALCRELGVEKPLFINASKNNSIDDIRMIVTQYATSRSMFDDAKHKIVILDEGERLSDAAQDALKGLIEEVYTNCRFIITANTKSKIIPPLQSRCQPIDFMFTKDDEVKMQAQMFKRCGEIMTSSGITFDPKVLASLVKKFSPDNRSLLQHLQTFTTSGNLGVDALVGIQSTDISVLIDAIKNKKFNEAKAIVIDQAARYNDTFYGELYRNLEPIIKDQSCAQLVLILGEYQRYHNVVPDKFIHFLALVTDVMMQMSYK